MTHFAFACAVLGAAMLVLINPAGGTLPQTMCFSGGATRASARVAMRWRLPSVFCACFLQPLRVALTLSARK
jgi:hypothetical protein